MVAQAARFFESELKNLLRAGRKIDLAAFVLAGASEAFNDLFDAWGFETQLAQDAGGNATFFADQAEQKVLGADVIVAQTLRFVMSEAEHAASSLG
jgi:hypothetical protein